MARKGTVRAMYVFALMLILFSGCEKASKEQSSATAIETLSFRNIPGITQSEISAIEALKTQYGSFVYGINPTTEAFLGKDGEINGYAFMLCNWLSEMFGIQFKPVYYQWGDLLRGLESGEVDFTGELMTTSESRTDYFMSSPTINRTIKSYRIKGSIPITEILRSRMPRYAFLREAVVAADVAANTEYTFDTVLADSHQEAYRMLKSGQVDAFFGLETAEGAFDVYGDVVAEEFYPLIFRSSCLSTRKAELSPVISVLEKAMNDRVLEYLTVLQKKGHDQYLENKIYALLTEEERSYIRNNPVIRIGADFSNYPISFFNTRTSEWQGIYFEALDEIAKLTGLTFQIGNDHNMPLLKVIDMVEKGDALIIPELFQIKEYEGRFIWSEIPTLSDNFVIISRANFRNIDVNDIFHLHVAIRKNTIYSEMFKRVFPAHRNFTEYETMEDTWEALGRGDADIIFASRRRLIIYTNYYEQADFKLNLVFDHTFDSFMAYNKDAVILKSIVDKALRVVNVNNIANQWIYKTYDYRNKMAAAQRPWLIGAAVLFLIVLSLVSILLLKSRSSGKQLKMLVSERTGELAHQTSMLKTMIASLPDGVFCKNLDFKYTMCSNTMTRLLGKEEAEIIGKGDIEALGVSAEAAEIIKDVDRKVISECKQISFEEYVPCVDGVTRLFETVKAPLVQNGKVTGIMGIARDITQRKKTESELSFKTSQLQMMIDSIPDFMFCKDLNFRYTQCNKFFEQFMGASETEILGRSDSEAKWFPLEQMEMIHNIERTVIDENRIITLEERVCSPSTGKESVFETVKAPIRQDGAVVGIIAIVRDITRRKEMEEEVMAASRAKTSFLANMSHELRTPLNVVIGLTDLLLENDHLDTHTSSNLIKISSAGNTLLSIVNDILDFSKIESGKLELMPVEYYTSSLLNDIITLVVTRLGEKPVTFHLNINDELPNKLFGDDLRVKQILTNLLTNAVKYTKEGSIELSVRCTREGDTVWMDATVSDTGMGIPKDDVKNLFLDYYQVAANSNRNIEGTGLGLPITKRLVEMMDGEIRVESEQGKGSTFSFRLKQGFVSDTPLGADVSEKLRNFCYAEDKRIVSQKLVRLNLNYARVLVVDDMDTNLDVAVGLLSNYKMHVDCLNSGPEAIERIRSGTPVYNAIFMDHMMPGMDGIEAADRIRALGTEYAKKIPIIALTANAIHGTDKMFYDHDFQAFITKPIDVVEMDTVIRKWVRDDNHEDVPVIDEYSEVDIQTESMVIEIPGVDTEKGLSLYAGAKKVYLPLLRSYAANTPKILEKLRTVSAETLPGYVITVHGLKGTSAGIGAQTIREAASNLETISRAGDLQGVLAQNDKLIADTEIIVQNIKAWLQQHDALNAKPRLKAPDRELLARLRQNCESYDMSGIDEAMAELEKTDYDEEADLVAWIREKIDISKIGEVAKRLAQYEEELGK